MHQGPKTGNAGGSAWPAYRSSKTYTDFTLQWLARRSGSEALSVLVMQ